MLQSPYLGDMRQEVEFWDSALQQVEEITELWFQCQKKVHIYEVYNRLLLKWKRVKEGLISESMLKKEYWRLIEIRNF